MKMEKIKNLKKRVLAGLSDWASAKREVNGKDFNYFVLICVAFALVKCFIALSRIFYGFNLFARAVQTVLFTAGVYFLCRNIIGFIVPQSKKERLREHFIKNYVSDDYDSEPVYETLCDVLTPELNKGGHKIAMVLYCAKNMGWISEIPSYKDAYNYWGKNIVSSAPNYSEQNKNFEKPDYIENHKTSIEGKNGLLTKKMNRIKNKNMRLLNDSLK